MFFFLKNSNFLQKFCQNSTNSSIFFGTKGIQTNIITQVNIITQNATLTTQIYRSGTRCCPVSDSRVVQFRPKSVIFCNTFCELKTIIPMAFDSIKTLISRVHDCRSLPVTVESGPVTFGSTNNFVTVSHF